MAPGMSHFTFQVCCFYNSSVFRSGNIVYSLFCGFTLTMTIKMTISIYNHLFILKVIFI